MGQGLERKAGKIPFVVSLPRLIQFPSLACQNSRMRKGMMVFAAAVTVAEEWGMKVKLS